MLQTTVDNQGQQMSTLIKWQQSQANPAIVKSKETATLANSLSKRVQALESSHMSRSAFEEWVDAEFAAVKDTANAALPRSNFEAFLMEEEETRSQTTPLKGGTEMERSAVTGRKRANDGTDDNIGGLAAQMKRRHGKGGSQESTKPGSDTFAAMGPPETPKKPTRSSQSQESGSPPATPSTPWRNAKKDKITGEEPWLFMEPTAKSAWSDQAMELLLRKWTDTCDICLSPWGRRHCGVEMAATAKAVAEEEELTDEKAGGTPAISMKSHMPPGAFTNLPVVQVK